MACDLPTILADACTNGIAPVNDRLTLLRYIAQLKAEKLAVDVPGTDVTLSAILSRACTSGIGKLRSWLALLRVIIQNICSQITQEIAFSVLNSVNGSGTSLATASVSPSSNALLLLVVARDGQDPLNTITSVTGCGLDWVLVRDELCGTTGSIAVYRALGVMPTSGAVTVEFVAARNEICMSLVQFSGVDTSGTSGSGAIVQFTSDSGAGANPALTLGAINPSALNATIGFCGNDVVPFGGTVEAGWTEDLDTGASDTEDLGLYISHKLLSTDATWTVTRGASSWGGIALEIKVHP